MDKLLTRLRRVFDSQDQLPGSACAGQPTAGLSSKEGRRRRAPHPLSGVQSRRQAIGTSRLPIPPPSHDRGHCEVTDSLSGSAGGILRFHSTQNLSGPLHGPTVPFLLQTGSRTKEANTPFQHLSLLTHSSVWQLVGGSLHMERLGRSPLAIEMAKMLQRQLLLLP